MTLLSDVREQDEGVLFLRRVAEDRFTDPLLLIGDEGVGRRFSTMQAVKEIYCQDNRESGCACAACRQVDHGVHPDLTLVTATEANPIKVETIRELIATAWRSPTGSTHRFVVIDGVDRMTPEASNALLKTLEEPPETTRFILLAESYNRVLLTIRSRCGKVLYRPLTDGFVLSVLHRFEPDRGKASIYARMGEGSVGRSISFWGAGRLGLRDRCFSLLQSSLAGDCPGVFSAIDSIGNDLPLALRFLEHLLHDLFMVSADPARMINMDLQEGIRRMRGGAKLEVWSSFGEGVRSVRERYRWTRINLAFHVKALFAETFVV